MKTVSEEQLIGLVAGPMEKLPDDLAEVLKNVAITVGVLLDP